jgi:hypothetical protein
MFLGLHFAFGNSKSLSYGQNKGLFDSYSLNLKKQRLNDFQFEHAI